MDIVQLEALSGVNFTHAREGEQVHQSSDNVIQSLREKLPIRPQEASLVLASTLLTRFVFETHSTDDCEEGIAVLDKLIASTPAEDNPDQYRARAAGLLAQLALARSILYPDTEYSHNPCIPSPT